MSEKFNTQLSKTFKTPEDYGAVGYSSVSSAATGGEDNTSALQSWANAVTSGERCYARAGRFYRCNSTVTFTPVGELIMDGAIVTPNTDIIAAKILDNFTLGGNRLKVRCYNYQGAAGNAPVWTTKSYPVLFDNAYSVFVATMPAWVSTIAYRVGNVVKVGSMGYRALQNNTGVNPPTDPSKWYEFALTTTDGGLTMAQKICAETNIGIQIDTCAHRQLELFANGYAINIALKPATLVSGVSYTAWNDLEVEGAESGKVQMAIITAGSLRWANENRIVVRGTQVGNNIATTGKSLYGFAIVNDDSVGSYSANGNEINGVDMEHSNFLNCPEFVQVVIHRGDENLFRNTRCDLSGIIAAKMIRQVNTGDFLLGISANPNGNQLIDCTRIHRNGAIDNGYGNKIVAKGYDDVESCRYSTGSLGDRLTYSGNDLVSLRGLQFWNGTAFVRFDTSQHNYKHYAGTYGNRIYAKNLFPGVTIVPGTRSYRSYWTVSIRGKGGRFGFHCFNSAGTLITTAGTGMPLIQNGTIGFIDQTPGVGTVWQSWSTGEDFDDEDYTKELYRQCRISFHESVALAVFSFHATHMDGFELRAYNSPGAQVYGPQSYSEENVVRAQPQKGFYTRPWKALYEQVPGAGVNQCYLDVGTTAFPTSWATSGAWTASSSVTIREEKHVVQGSDYRVYRATATGTTGTTAPTGTTYGALISDGLITWETLGLAEQLAAFSDQ